VAAYGNKPEEDPEMQSGQRETGKSIASVVNVLTAALLLLGGCGSLPDDQAASSGSQFSVAGISGVYNGEATNQVDIEQNYCDDDVEYYSDHLVEVAFLNRPLPNATEQTASMITLNSLEIRYTPLDTVTAPYVLTSPLIVEIRDNNAIPACDPEGVCAAVTISGLYFVPIQTKSLLRQYYIASGNKQLAYNANYVFKGTNDFGEVVTAVGRLQFYVANYDYCEE